MTDSMPASPAIISIATAMLIGKQGKMLLVRKHNTLIFMQPGGKIEPSEQPIQALIRELREELQLIVDPAQLTYIGHYQAIAANEPGCVVKAELFKLYSEADITPAAEIAELIWIDPSTPIDQPIAPLTRDVVIPLCQSLAH